MINQILNLLIDKSKKDVKYNIDTNISFLLFQMVELLPGTRVYLHQYNLDFVTKVKDPQDKGTVKYGKRVAKLLLNIFFAKEDFVTATLSPLAKGKRLLDQRITDTIISKFSSLNIKVNTL